MEDAVPASVADVMLERSRRNWGSMLHWSKQSMKSSLNHFDSLITDRMTHMVDPSVDETKPSLNQVNP